MHIFYISDFNFMRTLTLFGSKVIVLIIGAFKNLIFFAYILKSAVIICNIVTLSQSDCYDKCIYYAHRCNKRISK